METASHIRRQARNAANWVRWQHGAPFDVLVQPGRPWFVRTMAAKKTAKSKLSTTKTSTRRKGRRGPRGPRSGSKTAFIMSQPLDLPAKDVVEAAKKAGHEVDVKYVYAVRSSHRSKLDSTEGPMPTAGSKKASTTRGSNPAPRSLEAQLNRLALEMGITNAEAALKRLREKLDRMNF